jgi:Catalytic LigB subunit of aromatic ring-opening dioxygenase
MVLSARPERVLFVGSGGLTHDLPGFYPPDDGVDYTEEARQIRNAKLNAELRVPGRSFTSVWDTELLAGLSRTDDAWLEPIAEDVAGRAGNGGNEAATWVAAWAAGGQALTTLAYEFNDELSIGSGVAVAAHVAADLPVGHRREGLGVVDDADRRPPKVGGDVLRHPLPRPAET